HGDHMVELEVLLRAAADAAPAVPLPYEGAHVVRDALAARGLEVLLSRADLAQPLQPRVLSPRAVPDEQVHLLGVEPVVLPEEALRGGPEGAPVVLADLDRLRGGLHAVPRLLVQPEVLRPVEPDAHLLEPAEEAAALLHTDVGGLAQR